MSVAGLARLAMLPMLKQLSGVLGGGGLAGAASQFEEVAATLARTIVEGRAGGGLVRITANAQRVIQTVELDPQALKMDRAVLGDLVKTAVNEALAKGADAETKAYDAATSKLKAELPGMVAGLMGGLSGGKRP